MKNKILVTLVMTLITFNLVACEPNQANYNGTDSNITEAVVNNESDGEAKKEVSEVDEVIEVPFKEEPKDDTFTNTIDGNFAGYRLIEVEGGDL